MDCFLCKNTWLLSSQLSVSHLKTGSGPSFSSPWDVPCEWHAAGGLAGTSAAAPRPRQHREAPNQSRVPKGPCCPQLLCMCWKCLGQTGLRPLQRQLQSLSGKEKLFLFGIWTSVLMSRTSVLRSLAELCFNQQAWHCSQPSLSCHALGPREALEISALTPPFLSCDLCKLSPSNEGSLCGGL